MDFVSHPGAIVAAPELTASMGVSGTSAATNRRRAVVIFVNYGPYYVARAAALIKPSLDAYFIERAAVQDFYP